MHNVIIYGSDHELAEIAAVGIRLGAGWRAEIAHDHRQLVEGLRSGSVFAILTIALQPGVRLLLELRDLLRTAKAYSTPVLVLSPEPDIVEHLHDLDVLPICSSFDPLLISALITEAVSTISPTASAIQLQH